MAVVVPLIKSQGIKTKLVPWINDLIAHSGVTKYANWIEPFFGTGVVGFNSVLEGKYIVGDTNPHIINFYKAIQNGDITPYSMREFLEKENKLLSTADENGYAHYREVKNRFNAEHSPYDFIFLSRAGFNGMMRFNKKGDWNIPFCKKPNKFAAAYVTKICNQVEKISRIISKKNWEFNNIPFYETIEKAGEGDLIYCDPPYYGRYVDYYNGWTEDDEERLFFGLKNTKAKFVLSTWHHNEFRENSMIEKYWNKFNVETKGHFYHSGAHVENRHEMIEALLFNFDLQETPCLESTTYKEGGWIQADDKEAHKKKLPIESIVNNLFEGDCLEIMKQFPDNSIDMVLCDLPYGTTQNKWDSIIPLDLLWKEYNRIVKQDGAIVLTSHGLFTAQLMLSNPKCFRYKWVWEKSKSTNFLNAKKQPLRKHEDVCVFYRKQPCYNPQMLEGEPYDKGIRKNQLSGSWGDFLPVHVQSDGKRYPTDIIYFKTDESEGEVVHPTQKPVELGRYLVRTYSNPGDLILDNTFGSGSFLVAALLEGRNFVGIEKNENVALFKNKEIDYIKVSKERLETAWKSLDQSLRENVHVANIINTFENE